MDEILKSLTIISNTDNDAFLNVVVNYTLPLFGSYKTCYNLRFMNGILYCNHIT